MKSLFETVNRKDVRITLVMDGSYIDTIAIADYFDFDYILKNCNNRGLGPSINMALAHIDALKRWDGDDNGDSLTVYCQDDVLYSSNWLEKLSKEFLRLSNGWRLGFASGAECPEHPINKDLGKGLVLKDWIRATNLLSTHRFWMSMYPISRIDPETGKERGRPHDGLGSSVDWWFIRNHQNSVCKTGRTNLVIPGLVVHDGFDQSTWLKRELPESNEDKEKIKNFRSRKIEF